MNQPVISPVTLDDLLAAGSPARVLDVSYYLGHPGRGESAYRTAHIPGAVFVDLEAVFAAHPGPGGAGGRHPLPTGEVLQAGLRAAGVNEGEAIVLVDQGTMMGAARAWWVLTDAGLEAVQVLAGGMRAWQAAGYPVATDVPEVDSGDITISGLGHREQVDAAGVVAALADGHQLVDVRSATRFRGEEEPVDPVAGHIPGAVNLPADRLEAPQGLRSVEELAQELSGLSAGDVVSCGSGITAAKVILAAEQAGVIGLRLYPGSWSDWISDPDREVAIGE
ncbi:sulfurtransferase [Propionibacteriaceae bacterium Y1923]|uniref:sulfurtransferase n=1 Tax=Aestuariimicrobium sp. Y1814 TaxID=3418742 RepID=UPI003C1E3395